MLSDEKGVLNVDKEPKEQPQNDVEKEEDDQREEEQPEHKQTEDEQQEHVTLQVNSVSVQSSKSDTSTEDTSMNNVNDFGYPLKGTFNQAAIFSYCKGSLENIIKHGRFAYLTCCALCKKLVCNNLKYVCSKHSGSGWHERTSECEKCEPDYIYTPDYT